MPKRNTFIDDIKVAPDGTIYHAPKNEIVNISEIWAFLSVDPSDNTEGVIAFPTSNGPMPMIAADAARLTSLIPAAECFANSTGVAVRLVKFSTREVVRTFTKKK